MNRIVWICLLCALAIGCSGSDDTKDRGHVLTGQQRALDKAGTVDQTLQDAATRQRRIIDEQAR